MRSNLQEVSSTSDLKLTVLSLKGSWAPSKTKKTRSHLGKSLYIVDPLSSCVCLYSRCKCVRSAQHEAVVTYLVHSILFIHSCMSVCMCLPSRHCPLKKTFCSSLNFSNFSEEEKFSSLETALHFRIFFGTRAGIMVRKSQ